MNIKNSEDPLSTHFFKIRLKAQPGFTRVKPMGKPGARWALRTLVVDLQNSLVVKRQTDNTDTGYPHDGRADNAAYRHDRRADKRRYPHDREIDIQM